MKPIQVEEFALRQVPAENGRKDWQLRIKVDGQWYDTFVTKERFAVVSGTADYVREKYINLPCVTGEGVFNGGLEVLTVNGKRYSAQEIVDAVKRL